MNFDVQNEVTKIVNFIRTYYSNNKLVGAVIGISGGKDSAVASALFTKALGRENVIGITMPCHSKNEDGKDAKIISDYFDFELYNFDLTQIYDLFKDKIGDLDFCDEYIDSDINLKPRLRMATLYYFAAMFTQLKRKTYIVVGTGNKCEIFVGYFTKGGDGMSDINVLANYTVSEVIEIGRYLGVPSEILSKVPSDGLSELSDEDKLGVSYEDIEKYLSGENLEQTVYEKIKELHLKSKHKKGIVTM